WHFHNSFAAITASIHISEHTGGKALTSSTTLHTVIIKSHIAEHTQLNTLLWLVSHGCNLLSFTSRGPPNMKDRQKEKNKKRKIKSIWGVRWLFPADPRNPSPQKENDKPCPVWMPVSSANDKQPLFTVSYPHRASPTDPQGSNHAFLADCRRSTGSNMS
ncbi:hypothetical protein AALO_G00190450, partial [Alosa alosa]